MVGTVTTSGLLEYQAGRELSAPEPTVSAPTTSQGHNLAARELFWLDPWEATGSPRSVAVMDAAHRVWEAVLIYTKEAFGDTELAGHLLEQTISSVEKQKHSIDDLSAYIFRSYIREVTAERKRRRRIVPFDESTPPLQYRGDEIERRILAQEVLAIVRIDILPLVFQRMDGWSWEEIAAQLGEPKHALESRYSYEMRRVRDLLGVRKRRRHPPLKPAAMGLCSPPSPLQGTDYRGESTVNTSSGEG